MKREHLLDSIRSMKFYMALLKKSEDKRMEKQHSEERKMRENYFRLLEKVQKIKEKMFHFLKMEKQQSGY
jgi:hypothetical protein